MSAAPTLERLQAAFQAHLLNGDDAIAGAVAERGRIEVAARLAIYRHAYRARLCDALRDIHGHFAAFLGEAFDPIALDYVDAHPSEYANLRGYGLAFPRWLASSMPGRPELAELAALDHALRQAFDGADATPATLADLAAVAPSAWDGATLAFVPSVARLRFTHNTLALWQAIDDDEEPPAVEALGRMVEVLVWRRGLQPHFRSVGALEANALDALLQDRSFAAVCSQLAASFPEADVALEAGSLLRRWVEDEVLLAVRESGGGTP